MPIISINEAGCFLSCFPLGVVCPLRRALSPAFPPLVPSWACAFGGRGPRPARGCGVGCRLRFRGAVLVALGVFFFRFFLLRVFFFRIFVAVFQFFAVGAPLCSSASAVVALVGFAPLRSLFAGFVVFGSAGGGSPFSARVAAACPAFAGALVGRGLCSWWVAWSVASFVASSWGVSVASGGVPAPGVQLSLFS